MGLIPFRLLILLQEEVSDSKSIHISAHETDVCIPGCPYNGLTTHVKRGVYDYGTTGLIIERAYQPVIYGVSLRGYRLYPR